MTTIWIPGGRGMLGTRLAQAAAAAGHDVTVTDRDTDVTDLAAVARLIDRVRPDVVINCAAYTAVDKAETEADAARALNATAPAIIAAESTRVGARLVHISTDYVFDGGGDRPLTEDDPTGPHSVYGQTKLEGERLVVAAGGLVVRTSWLYAATHSNFLLTMLRLMAEREELKVVSDQRGRPTSTSTLSAALLALLQTDASGIVHVADDAGATGISWYDFAVAIRDEAVAVGLPMKVQRITPIPTSAYPTPATRPAWSVFDTSRYTALTGQPLPPWRTSLQAVMAAVAASRS